MMNIDKNGFEDLNQVVSQRVAERWLLVGPDEQWCDRAKRFLEGFSAAAKMPSFLFWRIKFGLLRVASVNQIEGELTRALNDPPSHDAQRSAAKVWAALSENDWYDQTSDCVALQLAGARGFKVQLFSELALGNHGDALYRFAQGACDPDTLPQLTWQMNGHPLPIPRNWLALAPLPELDQAQNELMANEGFKCYEAWADDVLRLPGSEEVLAFWSQISDEDEFSDKDEPRVGQDDPGIDSVRDMQAERAKRASFVPQSSSNRMLTSGRMAASGATAAAGGLDALLAPLREWELTPTVSRGATALKAFCFPPEEKEGSLPRVAFVASWNDRRKMVVRPEDLCLVLTLSKRKPVLLKGEPDPNDPMQVRFKWPSSRWPEGMPSSPQAIKRWLRDHFPKARVSLQ